MSFFQESTTSASFLTENLIPYRDMHQHNSSPEWPCVERPPGLQGADRFLLDQGLVINARFYCTTQHKFISASTAWASQCVLWCLAGAKTFSSFKEKTLTDTSKFVMVWRFNLYPKVFLKGFERLSRVKSDRDSFSNPLRKTLWYRSKRQTITNLLVSVSVFSLKFSPSVMPFKFSSFFFHSNKQSFLRGSSLTQTRLRN